MTQSNWYHQLFMTYSCVSWIQISSSHLSLTRENGWRTSLGPCAVFCLALFSLAQGALLADRMLWDGEGGGKKWAKFQSCCLWLFLAVPNSNKTHRWRQQPTQISENNKMCPVVLCITGFKKQLGLGCIWRDTVPLPSHLPSHHYQG